MPPYIPDAEVAALAHQARALTGADTLDDAVRTALVREIARARREAPLRHRADAPARSDVLGAADPDFDLKRFRAEMWDA